MKDIGWENERLEKIQIKMTITIEIEPNWTKTEINGRYYSSGIFRFYRDRT